MIDTPITYKSLLGSPLVMGANRHFGHAWPLFGTIIYEAIEQCIEDLVYSYM